MNVRKVNQLFSAGISDCSSVFSFHIVIIIVSIRKKYHSIVDSSIDIKCTLNFS